MSNKQLRYIFYFFLGASIGLPLLYVGIAFALGWQNDLLFIYFTGPWHANALVWGYGTIVGSNLLALGATLLFQKHEKTTSNWPLVACSPVCTIAWVGLLFLLTGFDMSGSQFGWMGAVLVVYLLVLLNGFLSLALLGVLALWNAIFLRRVS